MKVNDCRLDGTRLVLFVDFDDIADVRRFVVRFKPGEFTLSRQKKKRSLDANRMMWALCQDIGTAILEPAVDVYRRALREGNVFSSQYIRNDCVERFIREWESRGIGWFADAMDKGDVYTLVNAYYGSSTFDVHEMSDLIDRLLQDARSIGLETISDREKSLLLEAMT